MRTSELIKFTQVLRRMKVNRQQPFIITCDYEPSRNCKGCEFRDLDWDINHYSCKVLNSALDTLQIDINSCKFSRENTLNLIEQYHSYLLKVLIESE